MAENQQYLWGLMWEWAEVMMGKPLSLLSWPHPDVSYPFPWHTCTGTGLHSYCAHIGCVWATTLFPMMGLIHLHNEIRAACISAPCHGNMTRHTNMLLIRMEAKTWFWNAFRENQNYPYTLSPMGKRKPEIRGKHRTLDYSEREMKLPFCKKQYILFFWHHSPGKWFCTKFNGGYTERFTLGNKKKVTKKSG